MQDFDEKSASRRTFFASSTPKPRPIREQPILGIDYDKLRYGNRKNTLDSLSQASTPRQSLIKNQTTSSFRKATPPQRIRISKQNTDRYSQNGNKDLRSLSKNQDYSSIEKYIKVNPQDQVDFEAFRKYQQEFQQFRKLQQSNNGSQYGESNQKNEIKITEEDADQKVYLPSTHRLSKSNQQDKQSMSQYGSLGKMSEKLFQSVNKSRQRESQKQPQQYQLQEQQQQQYENENGSTTQADANKNNLENNKAINNYFNGNNNIENCPGIVNQPDQQYSESQQNWFKSNQDSLANTNEKFSCPSPDGGSSNGTYYSKMVDKYMDKNSDYFKHLSDSINLSGNCLCGKCLCGKCKCPYKGMPFDSKKGLKSMYQQDFKQPSNVEQLPIITMDFFTQQQQLDPINCMSINQSDFQPHEAHANIHKAPQQKSGGGPFISTSTYKVYEQCYDESNYIDWQGKKILPVRAPQDVTTALEAPFNAKSLYSNYYGGDKKSQRDREFEELIKNKSKSSLAPFSPDFKYFPQSQSQRIYQTPHSTLSPCTLLKPYVNMILEPEAVMTPSALNQFKSLANIEYNNKFKVNCPSQQNLMDTSKKINQEKQAEYAQFLKSREKQQERYQPGKSQTYQNGKFGASNS